MFFAIVPFLEIPHKECILESSKSSTGVSLVYLEHRSADKSSSNRFPSNFSGSEMSKPVTFLASPICFKFSEKYLEEGDSSSFPAGATLLSLARQERQGQGDISSLSLNNTKENASSSSRSMTQDNLNFDHINFQLHYSLDEDLDFNVAMFMRPTTKGGTITLCGFDIGIVFPNSGQSGELTDAKAESESVRLNNDRFRRDEIILHLLKNFNY